MGTGDSTDSMATGIGQHGHDQEAGLSVTCAGMPVDHPYDRTKDEGR